MAEQEQQVTGETTADDSGEERRERRGNRREHEGCRNNRRGNTDDKYIERVVTINRVAKVVKGGRNFSFCALVVAGDGEGTVGVGYGKAREVSAAITKGVGEAKKSFSRVPMVRRIIIHEVLGEDAAGVVLLRLASPGAGVIAGGPVRVLMECVGIHDVLSESLGFSNAINIVRGAVAVLRQLEQPEVVATRRGLSLEKVTPAGMLRVRVEGEAEVRKDVEKVEAEAAASGVSA